MNIINKDSYASLTPSIDISRSRFEMNHGLYSSGDLGQLLPIEVREILPGDSFEYKTSSVVRLQPLVAPLMDDIRYDIFWFFCPDRILWDHTKEFFGENTAGPWAPQVEYTIPQIEFEPYATTVTIGEGSETVYEIGAVPGSLGDYLGIPFRKVMFSDHPDAFIEANKEELITKNIHVFPSTYNSTNLKLSVNHLPFRAYCAIVNEFFRSEALQNPVNYSKGDATVYAKNSNNISADELDYVTDLQLSGKPFTACKLFDIFTACLPSAQRAAEPVMALPDSYVYFGDQRTASSVMADHDLTTGAITAKNGQNASAANYYVPVINQSGTYLNNAQGLTQPNNWLIDGVSVEQIRVAFQVQRFYEATARSGGRYRSILESLFHVHASDQSMQVPQFLGSQSFYANVNQVLQTSESGNTPQGNPAGISVTSNSDYDFMQSFTEHGYLMGLMVARYHHTYQNGIDPLYDVKDKFDIYWPQFANVGEQPTVERTLFMSGIDDIDNQVFGYQEAYARYRYAFNSCTGEMRSSSPKSLDMYHLADDYYDLPELSAGWIMEDKYNLDRCLAVTSDVANQFWFNFYFDITATRPMPVHSIPGLVDHH